MIEKTCGKIQKQIEKTCKKVFGYRNMAVAITKEEQLVNLICSKLNIDEIESVDLELAKQNNLIAEYSKYKTLNELIKIYLNAVCLEKFNDFVKYYEFENYNNVKEMNNDNR